MMWGDLAPAGNPIVWQCEALTLEFAGYRAVWLQSGTAALALALIAARLRRPDVARPEVVLPGYGCPDLVAAAEFAGLRVVLSDIGDSDPGYDLAALPQALNANTVAVVAVNFLGIKERLADLRQLIPDGVSLVEDNAQWFPEPAADLCGDFICLSFGRGKPVSLLGGGALLVKESLAAIILPQLPVDAATEVGSAYRLKILAYNQLLNPLIYGVISRNPLLKLGQTVFKPLLAATSMDMQRQSLLNANVRTHLARPRAIEQALCAAIAGNPLLHDVAASAESRSGRLLRYPFLCRDEQQREVLLSRLQRAGLGCTAMYRRVLPEIPAVIERVVVSGELRGARQFAQRLLTLPVHTGVADKYVEQMAAIIANS